MKKPTLFIFCIMIVFMLVLCSKNEEPAKILQFVEEKKGGCHLEDFASVSLSETSESDTIMFRILDGKLNVFIGLKYLCCAPFESTTSVENNIILITITDTCPNPFQGCYCRCYCYYTWEFIYSDFAKKLYKYKVILNDPMLSVPKIIQEGEINLSQL